MADGSDTYFLSDPWLQGVSLKDWFRRLFELSVNKWVSVAIMFPLGWEEWGEAWS